MSKCIKCGNEILSGDIHWEMGLCNKCYNKLYKYHNTHISLDKMWLKLAQDFRDENEQLQTKINDLQSQLAEKEKEIEEYKRICTISHLEDLKIENMLLKSKDQDKISFAVEQLEKVKENIHYLLSFDYNLVCRVNEQIDSQIKELKGEE